MAEVGQWRELFAPDMDFHQFFADMKLPALPNMETSSWRPTAAK